MKLAICGIGNKLRGDDGVGLFVIERLKKDFENNKNILLLDCGSAPENFTSKIQVFHPDKIILVDAVDMKKPPGTVETVDTEKIKGLLISTHKIPVSLFIKYLQKKTKAEITFIGIQPKQAGFNEEMSEECREALVKVERILTLFETFNKEKQKSL